MARSFKKKNYVKDAGTTRKRYYQKLSNSRLRQQTKLRIKQGEWDNMPLNRELTNQWDVCDWRWFIEDYNTRGKYRLMTLKNEYIQVSYENWVYYYNEFRWYPRVKWFKGRYRLLK